MKAFTVHERKDSPGTLLERADAIAFVKEGFAWPALFFPLLWLIYHRLWLVLLAAIVAFVAIELGIRAAGLNEDGTGWIGLLIGIAFAFYANDARRWTLSRRRYDLVGAVTGASRADCEQRFFAEWLKQADPKPRPAQPKPGILRRIASWRPVRGAEVAIVDYGSGNLHSAAKAFERAARDSGSKLRVKVTSDPNIVRRAERIVLPGVGAFADCMRGLEAIPGMRDALEESVRKQGKPFLGICVGMQLMADRGLEFGETKGLGWMQGDVRAIEPKDASLKIPHMGWNTLALVNPHALLDGIALGPEGLHAYFVHSFQFVPANRAHVVAETDYGGAVTAMVARDNLAGTQFHPEKSQKLGLKLIANFLKWKP